MAAAYFAHDVTVLQAEQADVAAAVPDHHHALIESNKHWEKYYIDI